MLEEMPTGFDQPQESMDSADMVSSADNTHDRLMVAATSTPVAGPSGSIHLPSSRRASSQDSSNFDEEVREEEEEEEEDDPDWSGDHEDPDDPEWTGREELPGATSVALAPIPKASSKKPPASHKMINK